MSEPLEREDLEEEDSGNIFEAPDGFFEMYDEDRRRAVEAANAQSTEQTDPLDLSVPRADLNSRPEDYVLTDIEIIEAMTPADREFFASLSPEVQQQRL